MEDIFTRLYAMPTGVPSYVLLDNSGDYTIILNSNLTHERQLKAYEHELGHIKDNGFSSKKSVDLIEIHAHKRG